jgi:hypothetical protein
MGILSNAEAIEDRVKNFLQKQGMEIIQTYTVPQQFLKGGGDYLVCVATEMDNGKRFSWRMVLNGERKIICEEKAQEYSLVD